MSRIIVVGGGIGGLATALAAAAQGHRVIVLERAAQFAEIGAGIQLAPNGLHALDRLGLGATVRATAVRMEELRFMDGVTGEHVVSMPLTEEYRERFGNPYVVVHRAELHTALLEACRAREAIELRGGCSTVGYEQDGTGVSVLLSDGEHVTADAMVGADGIHSAVRRQLVGDGDPRISGITVYRAVIPMEQVPGELRHGGSVTWWTGPHCHFVHYPIAGGKYLNLAASSDNGAAEALAGVPVTKDAVRREFGALGPDAQRLLELGEGWRSWVLVDRDPVERWTDERVVLLGDAAHPMLHYVAQGACQGLEDAVALGDLLDCGADELPQRFEKYNAERGERTARIQRLARESIKLWHAAGATATARNERLAALAPAELHDYVAWMHGARTSTRTTAWRPGA
ncbi:MULTISPECIES: FAD-dependent monooxygenase [unclassified Streptomyces]|uniref:FAD-dependent monooxygenase n=1 Tax=unclassified Streptomyces TaxID=2593676 RepID=UPI000DAD3FCD|nr:MULTISPECIES: FAD-dependent monooxygenase [unclassified Streptomyces]PZT74847.1 3-hydroxybenzoate 6-monooxygenase [Streptomyces sp. AC1-42T]PZT82169.1 3-hydroxybenzoate 6-monooxygenase [Streptomyces sp. AC1-42W]